MATSGTWAFDLDIGDVIQEAYERIGKDLNSGYDYRTARRSLDLLMLEWQNRGLNLWTIKNASLTLVSGTASYALPSERVDVIEGMLRTDSGDSDKQADLMMRRLSVNSYARQTNKLAEGRPVQYYVERAPEAITLYFWPVPDAVTPYEFNYYYMERIEDSGASGSNNMDVPARFLPALVTGLAYQLGLKTPAVAGNLPALKAAYEEQWDFAADAAREKASWYLRPAVS